MSLKSDLMLGLDPVRFSQAIGIDPDGWQAEVLRSTSKRLLLNCCRQSGKSTTTATLGLHTAIYTPRSLVLLCSPTQRQSAELFKKLRDGYSMLPDPPPLTEDNKLSMTLLNGSRVVSLPGDPATVRGYSKVSLLVLDEAAMIADDFYAAVLPMLMIGNGRLIAMSTPNGKRGFFYDEWTIGENWQRISIDAKQCPRMTPELLEEQRRSMGEQAFRQEFCCEFADNIEATFNSTLIQSAFTTDVLPLEI